MLISMPIEFNADFDADVGLDSGLDADMDFDAYLDADLDAALDADLDARWAFYKDVVSFGSLLQSFASMTDVIMLSNWPIFMDAAADVGNWYVATVFFYSFKVRFGLDIFAFISNRST